MRWGKFLLHPDVYRQFALKGMAVIFHSVGESGQAGIF